MITAVKTVLESTLERVGIAKEKIARNAREEQALINRLVTLPLASLITDPGRFETPNSSEIRLKVEEQTLYRQVRAKRVMPVVMKVIAKDELEAGALISRFIEELPFFWEYGGIEGVIEPVREEYSDYESRMDSRYEAAVVVEFAVDVGPSGTSAEAVDEVTVRGDEYEKI